MTMLDTSQNKLGQQQTFKPQNFFDKLSCY